MYANKATSNRHPFSVIMINHTDIVQKAAEDSAYLQIAFSHVLQYPDAMGPGIIVAGVTAGCFCTDPHFLLQGSLQPIARSPRSVFSGFSMILQFLFRGRALLLQPLQHPASVFTTNQLSRLIIHTSGCTRYLKCLWLYL